MRRSTPRNFDFHTNTNHHAHRPEQHLQIFRELLAPRVAGIHRDEVADVLDQTDDLRVAREGERLSPYSFRVRDREDLLRDHTQNGELDAVELIKTTPQPALAQPLKNLGHVRISLLVRAICDYDEDA